MMHGTTNIKELIVHHDDNSSSKLICVIQEVGLPSETQNSILADNWLTVAVLTSFSIMIFHMGIVVMGGHTLSADYLCLSCRDTDHLHMYVYMYVHTFMDSNIPTCVCVHIQGYS